VSGYWVMDRQGLVLGPVSLQVLIDISAQTKFQADSKASVDGKTWMPIRDIPELARALLGANDVEKRRREIQEAQRIDMLLDRYREMKTHELFTAKAGASSRDHRPGFLTLAKPYHPGRLPKDAAPELVRICMEMFQFLSTRMAELEAAEKAGPRPSPAARPPSRPPMAAAPSTPPPSTARFELRRTPGKPPDIHIAVDRANLSLFSDHKLINVSMLGFFLPSEELLHLGTAVQVHLTFKDPERKLSVRGVVVIESTATGSQQTRGFGVRMERLTADESTLLKSRIQELKSASERR
jgi:hypothetical protein